MNIKHNPSNETLMQKGFEAHQNQDWTTAKQHYKKVLQNTPNHFNALRLLGTLYQQTHESNKAEKTLLKAHKLNESHPGNNYNLGCIYLEKKRFQEAINYFKKTIKIEPNHLEALNNLGMCFYHLDKQTLAIKTLNKAKKVAPASATTHANIGMITAKKQQNTIAIKAYKKALSLKYYEYWQFELAKLYEKTNKLTEAQNAYEKILQQNNNNQQVKIKLGNLSLIKENYTLAQSYFSEIIRKNPENISANISMIKVEYYLQKYQQAKQRAEKVLKSKLSQEQKATLVQLLVKLEHYTPAKKALQQLIKTQPNNAEYLSLIGSIYCEIDNWPVAIKYLKKALDIDPKNEKATINLAYMLGQIGELDTAKKQLSKLLTKKNVNEHALINYALLYHSEQKLSQAKKYYQKAIKKNSSNKIAEYNLGLILLQQQHFKKGWQLYEARIESLKFEQVYQQYKALPYPEWDGSDIKDKHIIIFWEQGVGDEIMFMQCLRDIIKISKKCSYITRTRFKPLLKRSFPEVNFIDKNNLPAPSTLKNINYKILIGSLPKFFRQKKSSFNNNINYLVANPTKSKTLNKKYKKKVNAPVIGISWTGSYKRYEKQKRAIKLKSFLPILNSSNMNFINLQYGNHSQEIQKINQNSIKLITDNNIDPLKSLDNLATQIEACDLIISIDNSTIHMAGALGKPTWVLVPFNADWRWGDEEKTTSIWYPSIRIFRQGKNQAWSHLIKQINQELNTHFKPI